LAIDAHKDPMMKRALWTLAAAAAFVAANGCGWQVQNMRGNQCTDGAGCDACNPGGRLRDRIGNGQLRDRIRDGAYAGPPHVQGDFLSGLQAWHAQKNAPPPDAGASPTVTYPYYTVRGPRDYFLNDPMPLGY
jgi:hypothetical protein